MQGNEILWSTFDVYESDRDVDDLIDTLLRIIRIFKDK